MLAKNSQPPTANSQQPTPNTHYALSILLVAPLCKSAPFRVERSIKHSLGGFLCALCLLCALCDFFHEVTKNPHTSITTPPFTPIFLDYFAFQTTKVNRLCTKIKSYDKTSKNKTASIPSRNVGRMI